MAQRKGKPSVASDEIVDVVEVKGSQISAKNFLDNNQKLISYVILGIAILAAFYFAYKYLYIGPREKDALNSMYKAEEVFAKDSFALALENPGGGFDGFLGIIDNYSGTKAANLAHYYAGISYLNLGKYEDALSYLEDYSAKDDVTSIMKLGALGDAHAELGDKDKALDYYKDAANKSENDLLAPYYLHKLALLYYSQGKTKEATEQLQKIKSKYPNSNEFKDAEKLLARLGQ
ncbi:MAG: tetratricopeptide repeat protein [Saprospiraceae bacterium]|jgi:tetratricopeptide (TPR) repeat protein|nr:tetratricopeptide repeat protein [Saprospiraceae bacterium]MBL0025406.1 tetratricopeptide repeat protein [Saprospiraceae bacterium]